MTTAEEESLHHMVYRGAHHNRSLGVGTTGALTCPAAWTAPRRCAQPAGCGGAQCESSCCRGQRCRPAPTPRRPGTQARRPGTRGRQHPLGWHTCLSLGNAAGKAEQTSVPNFGAVCPPRQCACDFFMISCRTLVRCRGRKKDTGPQQTGRGMKSSS